MITVHIIMIIQRNIEVYTWLFLQRILSFSMTFNFLCFFFHFFVDSQFVKLGLSTVPIPKYLYFHFQFHWLRFKESKMANFYPGFALTDLFVNQHISDSSPRRFSVAFPPEVNISKRGLKSHLQAEFDQSIIAGDQQQFNIFITCRQTKLTQ